MAQLNITLNQEEILQLMASDREGAFKELLAKSLNQLLQAESTEQLKAEPYERSDERTDSRNGSYTRTLTTRLGSIELKVPRHRNVPFKTLIFDNYTTSEAALVTAMAEMVVNGVSTRKVSVVMETLCGKNYSKSTVSEACKELDKTVLAFKNREIKGEYPFVSIDATYFKVREDQRVISKALFIAYAVNSDGHRVILGFEAYPRESKETWEAFLLNLSKRGLKDPRIITSDAHEGIRYAITRVYPETAWQRCQTHFARNILENTPDKYKTGLGSELVEMFNAPTYKDAMKRKNEIMQDYSDIADKAMRCLDEGFDSAMTVMLLPIEMRREFRTSNHIERLNKELKRRSKAIGIFPNEESLIRIIGAVLMERNQILETRDHKAFYKPGYEKMKAVETKLKAIAAEQRGILIA